MCESFTFSDIHCNSLVADVVLFNSHFNMASFLESIDSFFKLIPDHKPQGITEQIRPKCSVLYFPLQFPFPLQSGEETASDSTVTPTSENTVGYTSEADYEDSTIQSIPGVPCENDHRSTCTTTSAANDNSGMCCRSERPHKSDPLNNMELELNWGSFNNNTDACSAEQKSTPLHILWPHRW